MAYRINFFLHMREVSGKLNYITKLSCLLLPFLLLACLKPHNMTIEPKMVALFTDLKLAELAWSEQPERLIQTRKIILLQHKTNQAEFSAYLNKLKNNPQSWETFLDSVHQHASKLETTHLGE